MTSWGHLAVPQQNIPQNISLVSPQGSGTLPPPSFYPHVDLPVPLQPPAPLDPTVPPIPLHAQSPCPCPAPHTCLSPQPPVPPALPVPSHSSAPQGCLFPHPPAPPDLPVLSHLTAPQTCPPLVPLHPGRACSFHPPAPSDLPAPPPLGKPPLCRCRSLTAPQPYSLHGRGGSGGSARGLNLPPLTWLRAGAAGCATGTPDTGTYTGELREHRGCGDVTHT